MHIVDARPLDAGEAQPDVVRIPQIGAGRTTPVSILLLMVDKCVEHHAYARRTGEDLSVAHDWAWPAT